MAAGERGHRPFSDYKVLSFDVFGTLIDWEASIYPFLKRLIRHLPQAHPLRAPFPPQPTEHDALAPRHPLIAAYDAQEVPLLKEQPRIQFEDAMHQAYLGLAAELGVGGTDGRVQEAHSLARSIESWSPFPDTIPAMQELQRRGFKLVALSNVSIAGKNAVLTHAMAAVNFEAAYCAEEIGSYKPDDRNFRYLLDGVKNDLGFDKSELLHIAHGVQSDQVRCEELGIDHVWVERCEDNWAGLGRDEMRRSRVVRDMQDFVQQLNR